MSSAGYTRRGISSVLGAMLVLAVVSTLVVSIIVYYLPNLKKDAEFKHEDELIDQFLRIADLYPNCEVSLKLGGGATAFNPLKTSATVEVNVSGNFTVEIWNGSKLIFRCYAVVPCLNLSTYNTRIENIRISYSEGGILMQQGRYVIVRKPPDFDRVLRIVRAGNSIEMTVYNYTSGFQEVAGNGFGFVSVRAVKLRSLSFGNITEVTVIVNDEIFQNYWETYLKSYGFIQNSSRVWILNLAGNATVTIYNVTIKLY